MKFYIRRAVFGAIAVPVIASIYFVFYALLIGAGAEPSSTPAGVWDNGLFIGWTLAVLFTFAPQIIWLENKLLGEVK